MIPTTTIEARKAIKMVSTGPGSVRRVGSATADLSFSGREKVP